MTEDEKIRAEHEARVSLLSEADREMLWQAAKAFCWDWKVGKIPRTPENSAKLQKQIDIFMVDCDPDRLAELLDAMTKATGNSEAAASSSPKPSD